MTAAGPRIGSLFSGYGGLDLGVTALLGGAVVWHSEIQPDAVAVLRHHWPDVPNLGDITCVDWSNVEPVDVITGGFPCQDVSFAGRRAGLRSGTRSGLWAHMAGAVEVLRPGLVLIENVVGLLSAAADSDVEPCPWCLGDRSNRALRALGAVLGDLADFGYDARWCGVRASDVGAPHRRHRIFVAATDPDRVRHQRTWSTWDGRSRPADGRAASAYADAEGRAGQSGAAIRQGRQDAVWGRGGPTAHANGTGLAFGCGIASNAPGELPAVERGGAPTADADGVGQPQRTGDQPHLAGRASDGSPLDWGIYEPAVHRWESVLGRAAPAPTIPGRGGQPVLSPTFVQWLMGLPAGHVTGVPGMSRNSQLRLLGNGVVPQQAAHALTLLLNGNGLTKAVA